jgi:hypothetical protein
LPRKNFKLLRILRLNNKSKETQYIKEASHNLLGPEAKIPSMNQRVLPKRCQGARKLLRRMNSFTPLLTSSGLLFAGAGR